MIQVFGSRIRIRVFIYILYSYWYCQLCWRGLSAERVTASETTLLRPSKVPSVAVCFLACVFPLVCFPSPVHFGNRRPVVHHNIAWEVWIELGVTLLSPSHQPFTNPAKKPMPFFLFLTQGKIFFT